MKFIDTHSHLHFKDFNSDLDSIVQRAVEAGVSKIITIGTDVETSKQSIEISKANPNIIFAAVGIHPTDCLGTQADDMEAIMDLADEPGVVAIGEIGLDLYWKEVPLKKQWEVFSKMKQTADSKKLPMIIHTRNAYQEMRQFFRENPPASEQPGVLHSFDGSIEDAKYFLDMGFYISFTGVVTFKNFRKNDLVKYIPLDRLLFETDSPFLSPHPKRGKRNEPMNLIYTAKRISEIKAIDLESLAANVYANSINLFKIE